MRFHRLEAFRCALSLLLFGTVVFVEAPVSADDWKAGVAKVNITPKEFMPMAGYASRDRPADGKLTDLWAKALVIDDGNENRAALVTLDLIGIDRALSVSVCNSLEQKYGLSRAQVALCTSHTHTGPVVARNLRPMHFEVLDKKQQKQIEDYSDFLETQIIAVVGEAIANHQPSQLSWGSGTSTFATNRRNNPEADVPKLREEGKLQGPFDHDVPVLAVRDKDGKLTGVVFGYACHSTVLSFYQWSGDYGGFAQIELEKAHPNCVAMFWAGCGGDQNPLPRRTVELAMEYGERLAKAVDKVLENPMQVVKAKLSSSYQEIDLPLDTLPTKEEIEADTKSKNRYIAARAKMLLSEINAGRSLAQTYPYPIQLWRIGEEVQFVALGGEVVVDYAIRLKSELKGTQTWVAGYANDVMAYIPSRRVLREGGYEGGGAMIYYGLPTVWAPEVEKLIIDEVNRQVSHSP